MRVLLLALPSNVGQAQENLRGLDEALAAHRPADLAVVAEAFGQGFESITDDPVHDLAIGWSVDGPEIREVRELALRHQTALCFGFIERDGQSLHSSAIVVDRAGDKVALYRRISPGWRSGDADTSIYADGTSPVLFDLAGMNVTVALCGDLWDMPERFAELEPDLLIWPIFVNYRPEVWEGGELDAYAEQSATVCGNALLVNSISTARPNSPEWGGDAHGGAAVFQAGRIEASLHMGAPGVLELEL